MKSHQHLTREIDDIILKSAKWSNHELHLSYEQLSDVEKSNLTALMIEDDGGDLFSVYENDRYTDILATFLRYLKTPNLYTRNEFTDVLRLSVVDYYKKRMTILINERIDEMQRDSIDA